MHIDSYSFGKIVIDGREHTSDCIILEGTVIDSWWRKQGHVLSPDDLLPILEAKPDVLVVGCGAFGVMKVSEQTRQVLRDNHITLQALKTAQAVERFNELTDQEVNVAAALHLTC